MVLQKLTWVLCMMCSPLYSAPHQFFRQLLADPEVFTQDPYEASLFYVPAWT